MPKGFVSFADVKRAVSFEAVLLRYGLLEGLSRKGANLAGPCPFCEARSSRQFQVNLVKNAWYCFGCKEGGNILDFVAKREGVKVREAALLLDRWFELGLLSEKPPKATPAASTPKDLAPEPKAIPTLNPPLTFALKTLDPNHADLADLKLLPATLESFGAGYCTKGLLKGRLAIPVQGGDGALLAYVGLATEDSQTPRYLFPPKFHPELEVFNLHRLPEVGGETGPLYLAAEIEGVLRLAEAGYLPALGLFDGSLSESQEECLAGALLPYERLLLAGEGFADRTVARLARYTWLSWTTDLLSGPPPEETDESFYGEEAA